MGYLILIVIVVFTLLLLDKLATKKKGRRIKSPKPNTSTDKLPYRLKYNFFNQSESIFFKILQDKVNKERYAVFAKTRLADLVEPTVTGRERILPWNKIKAKHIDFVIWDQTENRIAMAIELDGKSHTQEKAKKNDGFKDRLFSTLNINFRRVTVGSDFSTAIDDLIATLEGGRLMNNQQVPSPATKPVVQQSWRE